MRPDSRSMSQPPAGGDVARGRAERDQEDKARSWGRVCLRFAFLRAVVALAWTAAILLSGASASLRTWAEKNISSSILAAAPVYLGIIVASYIVVSLPLEWLGWKAEVRYGLSRKGVRSWLGHAGIEAALAVVFGVAFFYAVYVSLFSLGFFGAGGWWWLATGFIYLCGEALLRRLFLQRLISLRYRLAPIANDDLREKLKALAEKAGSRIETFLETKVREEGPAANAMIGGLGRKKAIFLTDTLLDVLSDEEVETVVSHELGHDRYSHPFKAVFLNSALVTSGLFFAHVALMLFSPVFPHLGIREAADVAAFPLLLFFLLAFAMFTSPASSAVSRRMEGKADAFALNLSTNPQAFSTALEKLAGTNLIDRDPPRLVRIISRAPPLRERIEMAKAFRRREGEV